MSSFLLFSTFPPQHLEDFSLIIQEELPEGTIIYLATIQGWYRTIPNPISGRRMWRSAFLETIPPEYKTYALLL